MPGEHELSRINEEIRRLEARRAEVEAMIKSERPAAHVRQLHIHLANVDRSLAALEQHKQRWFAKN
jgi:hypothetical protein